MGNLGRVGVARDNVLVRLQERLPVTWLPVVVVLLILGARPVALLSELPRLRWDDVFAVGGEGLRVPAADCLLALRNCGRPVGPPGELPGLHAH